jgi:hypothetical protein
MLDRQTAKALKNAGFPQGEMPDLPGFEHQEGDTLHHCGDCVFTGGEWVRLPQLEDLIRELGEDFESLVQNWGQLDHESDWVAFATYQRGISPYPTTGGKTPEEALAALWLALRRPPAKG